MTNRTIKQYSESLKSQGVKLILHVSLLFHSLNITGRSITQQSSTPRFHIQPAHQRTTDEPYPRLRRVI